MKISLLAHNLRTAGGLSVGKNIVTTLPQIAPNYQYLMIIPEKCGYPELYGIANTNIYECPEMSLISRLRWERGTLSKVISDFQPDWIWALGNMPLALPSCKQSLLFHNAHRLYPDVSRAGATASERIFKRTSDIVLSASIKWVNRVYCQTNTMRQRFHNKFSFPLDKIGLCPNAFSSNVTSSQKWPIELEPYRGKFILFTLTRYYPHKNLEIIVETFREYRDDLRDVICVMSLHKNQGRRAIALIDSVRRYGLENNFLFTGPIPQERLGDYFCAAAVMFLPTLLESFSGTYLEAMQLDTPILTSDRDFAREVCGDAAEYIDPLSPADIKKGIIRLKSSPERMRELIKNGQIRKTNFLRSWPEILRDVLVQEGIECEPMA